MKGRRRRVRDFFTSPICHRFISKLSPIVSEFETEEEAETCDKWFRAKVEAALADPRPSIPHDEVMAQMRDLLERNAKQCRDV